MKHRSWEPSADYVINKGVGHIKESVMGTKMRHLLSRLHRDESGAMSVEKILILALISLPLLVVLYLFRNNIVGYFNTQSSAMQSDANSAPPTN
jgi:Flp pilus assembly pilin Flp